MQKIIQKLGPGFLVAATGIGAGDLITSSLGGHSAGLFIIIAPLIGAVFKWILTEGLARYQISQSEALIIGWSKHLGRPFIAVFFVYLILWSYMVGGALINATGVAANALLPLSQDIERSKIFWGLLHSVFAVILIKLTNFQFFEKLMSFLLVLIFILVFYVTIFLFPDRAQWSESLSQWPSLNDFNWFIAVIGGLGGTVTILSYGHWIQENKKEVSVKDVRIDLTVSYGLTALFSMAMIIIGSQLDFHGQESSTLPLVISDLIGQKTSALYSKFFLIGFWAAVCSSMLGVWQSVPYLYQDLLAKKDKQKSHKVYSYSLYLLASIPCLSLFTNFKSVQLLYSITGALFIPFLAFSLLYLNREKIVQHNKNSFSITVLLILSIIFFLTWGLAKLY